MRWLTEATPDELRLLVDENEFFWLDLTKPTHEDVAKLADATGADPASSDRALRFGEVPHLRLFRGHTQLVFYGAESTPNGQSEPVEVHVHVSDQWVVSVREGPCRALADLPRELDDSPPKTRKEVVARVLGTLAGSFEDLLESADETIERLEQAAAEETRPAVGIRQELFQLRGRLFSARRLVGRQRDYIEHAVNQIREIPGFDTGERHELRDVAGQMIRVADRVDDALHRINAGLDQVQASAEDRLNVVMERLTIVATIFLPLTVVTGFFGMNFAWLVGKLESLAAFLALGVGLSVVSGLLIYMWLKSRLIGDNAG